MKIELSKCEKFLVDHNYLYEAQILFMHRTSCTSEMASSAINEYYVHESIVNNR